MILAISGNTICISNMRYHPLEAYPWVSVCEQEFCLFHNDMDNVSANDSGADNVAALTGTATVHAVLLLIVLTNTLFNCVIIAALIDRDNSELVRSIRVILVNILAASILGALASAMYHTSSPVLRLGESDTVHGPPLCHSLAFLTDTSSTGRVLFAAYYGVTVFIVVHYWHQPVLAPRNTKYFIIASAFVWLLAIAAGVPSLFSDEITASGHSNGTEGISFHFTLHVTVPYFLVSSIPIFITPVILIETSCYIKKKTIGDHKDGKKALVKFGLFLMIIQGVNAFAQIVVPLLAIGIRSMKLHALALLISVALSDLSRIPTSVLIISFFKPVRDKVKRYCFVGCKHARSLSFTTSSSNNA